MNMKRKALRLKPGTFVRIPLADGSFGYGRVLSDPYMAFYDHRTAEPSSDLDEIESKPVLFTQAVRLFGHDGWGELGHRTPQGEVAKPVICFRIWRTSENARSTIPMACRDRRHRRNASGWSVRQCGMRPTLRDVCSTTLWGAPMRQKYGRGCSSARPKLSC